LREEGTRKERKARIFERGKYEEEGKREEMGRGGEGGATDGADAARQRRNKEGGAGE
jgi:hypothetical protein